MKKLLKLMGIIIILGMFINCVNVYAEEKDAENGDANKLGGLTGGGSEYYGYTYSGEGNGGDNVAYEYGFAITLQPVSNKVTEDESEKLNGTKLTECTYQVSKELMYKFPTNLVDITTVNHTYALLRKFSSAGNNITTTYPKNTKVGYTGGSQNNVEDLDATIYDSDVKYTNKLWSYENGPLYKLYKELSTKQKNQSLSEEDGITLKNIEAGEGKLPVKLKIDYLKTSGYVQSVMYLFADYGNSWDYINETFSELDRFEAHIAYFDLCAAINTLCGKQFTSDLEELYKYKNSSNSNTFLAIAIESVVITNYKGQQPVMQNLPSYFAFCMDKDITEYTTYKNWNKGYNELQYINGKQPTYKLTNNVEKYCIDFFSKYLMKSGDSDDWYRSFTLPSQKNGETLGKELSKKATYCSIWFGPESYTLNAAANNAGYAWAHHLATSAYACNCLGEGVGGLGYSYLSVSPVESPPIRKVQQKVEWITETIDMPKMQFKFTVDPIVVDQETNLGSVNMTIDLTQPVGLHEQILTWYDFGDLPERLRERDGCYDGDLLSSATLRIEIARVYEYNGTVYEASTDEIKLGKVIDSTSADLDILCSGYDDSVTRYNTRPGLHTGASYFDTITHKETVSTLTLDNISYTALEEFIKGDVVLTFEDTKIPVPKVGEEGTEINVQYYANVSIVWGVDLSGNPQAVAMAPVDNAKRPPGMFDTLHTLHGDGKYVGHTWRVIENILKVNTIVNGKVESSVYKIPKHSCGTHEWHKLGEYAGLFGEECEDEGSKPIDKLAEEGGLYDTPIPIKFLEKRTIGGEDAIVIPQRWALGDVEYGEEPVLEEPKWFAYFDTYKSIPQVSYAEIKQGVPYVEIYEAMSGTPTDANLYVTFGNTMTVANMGLEMKKDFDGASRNYTYSITFENCVESNNKCEWSCPGTHSVSIGGCGALAFCTGELNSSPDEDGNFTAHSHTGSCYCNSGDSVSFTCIENGVSGNAYHQVFCKCGATEAHADAGAYKPSGGVELNSCTSMNDGHVHCTGLGCQHNEQINEAHPHSHIVTGTVTQNIGEYVYADIEHLDVWALQNCIFDGNSELLSNPLAQSITKVGYQHFLNQAEYLNNNGRLKFKTTVTGGSSTDSIAIDTEGDKNVWGDIVFKASDSKFRCLSSGTVSSGEKTCDTVATNWMNAQVKATSTEVTVVSDYALLLNDPYTSSSAKGDARYQSLMYHAYTSPKFKLAETVKFSTGDLEKTVVSDINVDFTNATDINGIKTDFSLFDQAAWDTIWTNNDYSTCGKSDTDAERQYFMQYGGYNGDCLNPSNKYSNKNNLQKITNADEVVKDNQPNMVYVAANIPVLGSWPLNTITGLNVWDNTYQYTYDGKVWETWWDSADNVYPVTNGLWDTGHAYVQYEKAIEWDQDETAEGDNGIVTVGIDKYYTSKEIYNITEDQWDDLTQVKEVGYTANQSEINDVVIYDPLALSAYVESCPAEYDKRVDIMEKANTFICLDRDFRIYFNYVGNFQGDGAYGLLQPRLNTLGKGWPINGNLDTTRYVREGYVKFPVDVIGPDGKTYLKGTWILMEYMPDDDDDPGFYTFHCLEENSEMAGVSVEFFASAINEDEVLYHLTNTYPTNWQTRAEDCYQTYEIDVIGSIGALAMTDTGDFRFANFFKNSTNGWLIPNVVPNVLGGSNNSILADPTDVLYNTAVTGDNKYISTYGITGKHGLNWASLPLTPADNNLSTVNDQLLRPGYKLYMDVETVGNYYGVNKDTNGNYIDYNGDKKMSITPRYWALNLDTNEYTPLDVYATSNGEYVQVTDFDNPSFISPIQYDICWPDEEDRRAFSDVEVTINNGAVCDITDARLPWSVVSDYIGTANKITLYDVNSTSIGSSKTCGSNMNPDSYIAEEKFNLQSQRWFFTLGIPSSSVFIESGLGCTEANIKAIESQNVVIVCAINIKVHGSVWTLEYDGSTINESDNGGFRVFKSGKVYTPPTEDNGSVIKDPIIAVYDKSYTSADDLTTSGTH